MLLMATTLVAEDAKDSAKNPPPVDTEAAIREKLNAKVTVEFIDTTLHEVVNQLGAEHDIPIVIDQLAIQESGARFSGSIFGDTSKVFRNPIGGIAASKTAGVLRGPLITDAFRDISLASVFRRVLRPAELTFVVEKGVLVITTPDAAESRLGLQTYDVADLAGRPVDDTEFGVQTDGLIEMITELIQPENWDAVGGRGSIETFRGVLTVSQTQPCQQTLAGFLKAFRAARTAAYASGLAAPALSFATVFNGHPESEAKIYAALEKPVDINFVVTPFAEIAYALSDLAEVNVAFDSKALAETGVDSETLVAFQAEQLPLKYALALLLRQRQLTFAVYDESLMITSRDAAEENLLLRCYPVLDLVADARPLTDLHDTRFHDYQSLIDLISSSIAPDSWDAVGGPSSLEGHDGVLAVSQTLEGHENVLALLAKLRAELKRRPPGNAPPVFDPRALTLEVYRVRYPKPEPKPKPAAAKQSRAEPSAASPTLPQTYVSSGPPRASLESYDPAELRQIVIELIAPESWDAKNNKRVYIRAVSDRLLIRQTPAVHRKIRALFEKLDVPGFANHGGIYCSGVFGGR